jgi:hypothetical protein
MSFHQEQETLFSPRISQPYHISFNPEQREERADSADAPTSSFTGRTTETSPTCPICLEDFTSLSRIYSCEHEFDYDCIMPWLEGQHNDHFNPAQLTFPCCRNLIITIRNTYRLDGSYSTFNVSTPFRSGHFNTGMAPMPIYFTDFWPGSAVYNYHFDPQSPLRYAQLPC